MWRSSDDDCSCKCKPVWLDGVQKYYNDDAVELFKSLPPGSLADQADAATKTFQGYIVKLVNFSNSKSKILSSGSTAILGMLSKINVVEKSAIGGIRVFNRMLPIIMKTCREVTSNLSKALGGELTCAVNNVISDLECSFKQYMQEFLRDDESGVYKEVDSEPFMKQSQKLANTISFIGETALNNCKLSKPDVQDALVVLSLILDYLMIATHGLSGCSEVVLSEQKCDEPVVLFVCSVTLGVFVNGFTKSLVEVTPSNENSIKALLRSLVNLTDILNLTFTNLFGVFEGVAITVGQITQSLSKFVSGSFGDIFNKLLIH